MISKIESIFHPPLQSNVTFSEGAREDFSSSLTTLAPQKGLKQLLGIVFYPLIWPLKKVMAKVAPTKEEMEQLENLIHEAVYATGAFVENRLRGERKLKEVIASTSSLYDGLTRKWFPNFYGVLFMRVHLIQINMRLYALIDDEEKIASSHLLLKKLGYQPRQDLEEQLFYLRLVRKSVLRPFFKLGYSLFKFLKNPVIVPGVKSKPG